MSDSAPIPAASNALGTVYSYRWHRAGYGESGYDSVIVPAGLDPVSFQAGFLKGSEEGGLKVSDWQAEPGTHAWDIRITQPPATGSEREWSFGCTQFAENEAALRAEIDEVIRSSAADGKAIILKTFKQIA